MKVYLFNPEHDMALASNSPFYKAPAEIIRMKEDLAVLPVWYADSEGLVQVDSTALEDFISQCVRGGLLPLGRLTTEREKGECSPWGWDPSVLRSLENRNLVSPESLQMERIRELSGRQCCVSVLDHFKGWSFVCGKAVVCRSLEEVDAFMHSYAQSILKAPWSGSGRGLVRTSLDTWSANLQGWVSRILRTQGFIMAEPLYNKVVDFAMEFQMDDQLSFVGYSLFETDAHGNYKSNRLVSDASIVQMLERYVSGSLLERVKEQLLVTLSSLIKNDYRGYLGVDMMICQVEGRFCIHPCVEINLRMNMGVVSRLLYNRYVQPGSQGSYVVAHFNADGEAVQQDREFRRKYPQVVLNGRMVKGYFPLTPVQESTRYQCYVLLEYDD